MRDCSIKFGLLLVAALLVVLLPPRGLAEAAKEPAGQDEPATRRDARLLRLTLPITSDSERLVKRFVTRAMDEAEKDHVRPVLIFELEVPPGQEDFGRGSQFGAAYEIAELLSGKTLAGATTVAYIPRSIQGHAVLVAIACDEIVMAPGAKIGSAGIDSEPVSDAMRAAYRDIAQRRRTVPVELALGMLDPTRKVLEVNTLVSREFVTPEGLEALRDHQTIKSEKELIAAGEPGQFTGAEGERLDFVSFTADDRAELARGLDLRSERIVEDVLAREWRAIRVDLEGLMTAEKSERIRRLIEDAVASDRANFVCLYIDSAGGSPTDSGNLANFLAKLPSGQIRTVAYIPEKARGDAAMVALACDQIVMLPDAVLGGSGDYVMSGDEINDMIGAIQERARRKSRSWSLPVAMVDPNLTVFAYDRTDTTLKEYFCEEEFDEQADKKKWIKGGQPVTQADRLFQTDGSSAVGYHLANNTVDSFAEFKEIYGLGDDPTLVEPGWADSLIRALASPGVAMLLLMVGGAALYAELHTPGVGLAGFLAIVCFVLFFWAQFIGENAAWLEVLLFLAGVGCLVIEVFVLPGFGIFGLGGGALILTSLVLATQTFFLPRNEYQFAQFQTSLMVVAGAGLGVAVLAAMLNRWLPHAPVLNRLMLEPLADDEKQHLAQSESMVHFEDLLGQQGTTTTQLTPSGKARFGDQLVDVIADGELIESGTEITVVEIHGNRVMVEPVEKED